MSLQGLRSARVTANKKPKGLLPRTFRDQIDAIAMAICLAIGLKFFLVEAYEIPTPSMQPTLMGSTAAGVHDRILVNKAAWLLRKPHRFDIAVFRYPHNRSQNYVKRIWGLGGEHLCIIGGNVYKIFDGDTRAQDRYECLAKPDRVQEGLWRSVHDKPASDKDERLWQAGSAARWNFGSEGITIEDTGRGARAVFAFLETNLLSNLYEHGYPASIVDKIALEAPRLEAGKRTVADLRWRMEIQPDEKTRQIEVSQRDIYTQGGNGPQLAHRSFRLTIDRQADDKAQARLEILEKPQGGAQAKVVASSQLTDLRLPTTRSFELAFVKVDGQLKASVDGRTFDPLEIHWKGRPLPVAQVRLELGVKGAKALRVLRNRLDRDIFYTNEKDHAGYVSEVRVPKGACWMLGDNTQNSADGRAWRTVTLRVSDQGKLLEPKSKEGHEITGNVRFHGSEAAWPPDPDENPVVVPGQGVMVLTDLWGEEHRIHASIHQYESLSRTENGLFVPEKYIIGRAFATFWPAVPWGQFRVGLIR